MRFGETERDWCTAQRLNELREVLVVDADLEPLDVGELGDRLLAKQHLRPERPNTEQLDVELLLQPLVELGEIRLGHGASRLVVRIQPNQVQAKDRRFVARVRS